MTNRNASLPPGELRQTVTSIFQTMLQMDVEPVASPGPAEPSPVTANVHFAGSWSGVLVLEMPSRLACRCAARFLSTEAPAGINDDVRDVMGELANIIGGNLKPLLPAGALLSVPEVIEGSDFTIRICAGTTSEHLAFSCDDGLFRVSLVHTQPDQAAA